MSNPVTYKIINLDTNARIDLTDHLPVGTDVILVYNLDTQAANNGGYPVEHTCLPHQLYVNKLLEIGELHKLGFIAINTSEDCISIGSLTTKRRKLQEQRDECEDQIMLIDEELSKY